MLPVTSFICISHDIPSSLGLKLTPEAKQFTLRPLMEFPTLSTKMIVCREWEENTGVRGRLRCCAGPRDHYASCKMTRLPFALSRRPYVFEGVDEGGRWYNGSRRTDGRRGLSVPHVWTSQHNGNPFFGLRTDGRTDRFDDVRRPPWKSPVRVRLRNNKTTAASQRDNVSESVKTAQPFAWPSLVLGALGRFAGHADFRRQCLPLSDVPDEFRGSPTAKIDLISELTLNNPTCQCVGREVSYYELRRPMHLQT